MLRQYKEQIMYFFKNKKYVISIILVAILSYGFTITHHSLGVDDISIDLYVNKTYWLSARRWGMWLLYNLLNIKEFTPFWLDLVTTILIMITALAICIFIRKNFGEKIKSIWIYIVFSCLMISNPLINLFYIYQASNLSVVLSNLGAILISIVVYENYFNKENKKYIYLISGIIISALFSIYESCAQTYLVLLFIIIFLKSINLKDKKERKKIVKFFAINIFVIILGIVFYYIESKIVELILKLNNENVINYATNNITLINKKFLTSSINTKLEITKEFFSYLVECAISYLPITIFTVAMIITIILELVKLLKTNNSLRTLSFLGIILSNYILPILQLGILYRTEFSLIITTAFLITYLYSILETKKGLKYLINIGIIFLLIYQTKAMNQAFYNEYKRYEKEKFVVNNISVEIVNNFDYKNKPIIFIKAPNLNDQKYRLINKDGQTNIIPWGLSAFEQPQTELIKFLNYYGYNFLFPTKQEVEDANKKYNELPQENKENIIEFDEFIVINLDKYIKTSK